MSHKRGFSDDFGNSFNFEVTTLEQQEGNCLPTVEADTHQDRAQSLQVSQSNTERDNASPFEDNIRTSRDDLNTEITTVENAQQSKPLVVIESEKCIIER